MREPIRKRILFSTYELSRAVKTNHPCVECDCNGLFKCTAAGYTCFGSGKTWKKVNGMNKIPLYTVAAVKHNCAPFTKHGVTAFDTVKLEDDLYESGYFHVTVKPEYVRDQVEVAHRNAWQMLIATVCAIGFAAACVVNGCGCNRNKAACDEDAMRAVKLALMAPETAEQLKDAMLRASK